MKRSFTPLVIVFFLLSVSLSNSLNAQCCRVPDSLKVKSVSDSSYCVQFNSYVKSDSTADSMHCDTAKSFELQWKRVGDSTHPWIDTIKRYNGKTTFTFCDTASPCTKYQWRVRNLCVKNGDTTRTAWIMGPRISTVCDSLHLVRGHQLPMDGKLRSAVITPNPAHDKIVITGNFNDRVQIQIATMQGKQVLAKTITVTNGKLNTMMSLGGIENGIYFVTVSDKSSSTKLTFIKE